MMGLEAVGLLRQDLALGYQRDRDNDDSDEKPDYYHGWLFHPDGLMTSLWGLTSSLMLVYITIVLPIRIAFDMKADGFNHVLDYIMELFFVADMIKTACTAYYDETGRIIWGRKQICVHYLKTDFIF
eukprot:SAG31_NODE_18720_length_625_cov_1.076046_1_plen_126_part_10